MEELLRHTADLASAHLANLDRRLVGATGEVQAQAELPDGPTDPRNVIDELVKAADPGLVASPGPRYFGFVTGGAVPASLAADWLVSAWDQNAFSHVSSPAAAAFEQVAASWVLDLLRLPAHSGVAFVTGCQMAHVTALAAARHRVLDNVGWSVADQGLFGPQVVSSEYAILLDRNPQEGTFDILRVDILATFRDDHVLLAPQQLQMTGRIQFALIAGSQPAVNDGLIGQLGIVEVMRHDGATARNDFADAVFIAGPPR